MLYSSSWVDEECVYALDGQLPSQLASRLLHYSQRAQSMVLRPCGWRPCPLRFAPRRSMRAALENETGRNCKVGGRHGLKRSPKERSVSISEEFQSEVAPLAGNA
jgi:hypothetical protein